MTNNPTKLLFIFTLISGTLISISANSWFGAWLGLEINLLSFIPVMTSPWNLMSTEASLKYFLTQALASATLLLTVTFSSLLSSQPATLILFNSFINTLILSTLLLKMGAAPFHFWFPGVMEGLSWFNNLILMTWQKIAPLMLLTYNFSFNMFTTLTILLSVIIGSLGGLNQTSLRKILAYSSINHLGWMIAAITIGNNLWNIYFLTYTFLTFTIIYLLASFNISHLTQTFSLNTIHPSIKFALFSTLLSLGGLPPFLGFIPKWLVIQNLVENGLMPLVTIMVTLTLITLFYYLRLGFSAFILLYNEISWNNFTSPPSTFSFRITLMLSMLSTLGLTIITFFTIMI